jgi:CDP-glycerol glycerophosphotransferase (TagB/SpsB family)
VRHLFYVSQLYSPSILRPIQTVAQQRNDECAWFFDPPFNGDNYLKEGEILLHDVEDVINFNPDAVYVPGNVVPDFFPGVKVQVFHGLATDDTGKKGHYRIRGFFDLYCTRGPEETYKFEMLARRFKHFRVAETGWPKIDPLFTQKGKGLKQRLDTAKPVVLYASTFSPSLTSAPVVCDTINELSGSGRWHWLVTLHPKMDRNIVARYRSMVGPYLTFIESHEDIIPLLQAADVMLCDTSSIAFEFQLLDKPLVTFRAKRPGKHLINVTDVGEIEKAVAIALTRPEKVMQPAREFMDHLHPYRDGRSSVRVLDATDAFIRQGRGHLKRKPFNMLRRIKIRKRLGYYRF